MRPTAARCRLPFESGENRRIAVKIIDDRGIESLKVAVTVGGWQVVLTELKLSNFRIFDDEVTVRFRPITILIGRNSFGKVVNHQVPADVAAVHKRPVRSQFLTAGG